MSFRTYKDNVSIGDTVVLYMGFNRLQSLKVGAGKVHQTKFGALRHNDLIGVRYGSKVQCSKGWLHVLHVSPELWTITLPHRTQILYTTDISLVIMQLDLKPGSVVVEAGTGSGSLSHALIRTIAPNGHLHTFDFHEQRSLTANEEFEDHGLSDLVTIKHRDVCGEGFDLRHVADAVFLDVPAPWQALPHAKNAIRKRGGRICSFSPCIEQVERTTERMTELGFTDITSMECLVRDYNIHTISMNVPDLGLAHEHQVEAHKNQAEDEPPIGQVVKQGEWTDPEEDKRQSDLTKGKRKRKLQDKVKKDSVTYQFKSAVPRPSTPGHTGYLTFATVYP